MDDNRSPPRLAPDSTGRVVSLQPRRKTRRGTTDDETPSLAGVAPAFSEEALALEFAERYSRDMRFVQGWGKWMLWDGSVWRRDDTLVAYDRARLVCREAAGRCNRERAKPMIASARTVAAVERLARADRRLAATVDQWDTDIWSLNTPDGVIDLVSGEMRAHSAADYLTRITTCAPSGDCSLFQAFLLRITADDPELVAFLARVFGYALTGSVREHALFFAYGRGANGKSALLESVSKILGEYAKSSPVEAFVASRGDRIPNDIAALRGARLVTSVETEEGQRWAESRLKRLTGGDAVPARYMRAEWFTFSPTFKLVIAGNHRPSLANVDEAMRRRLHVIPFDITIPAPERDLQLADKLQAEGPGILAWMLRGCADWQRRGLDPPARVREATDAYLAAEDAIATWASECVTPDRQGWLSSTELFASWKAWAERSGETPGSQRAFSMKLIERGWRKADNMHAKGFSGFRVREPDAP